MSRLKPSFRPSFEPLEDRSVPAVITVTTNVDDFSFNNGMLSLREAIAAANANSATYAPYVVPDPDVIANTTGTFGADTIVFAAGVNAIVLFSALDEFSLFGPLSITDSLSIQGPGADLLTVSGQNATRIFNINSAAAQVNVTGLTVANGATGPVIGENGGGFLINTNVFLDDVVIRNSSATRGGGIFLASGLLRLGTVTISNNTASTFGGGIAVANPAPAGTRITSTGAVVTIEGNSAISNGGGGIYLAGAQLDGSGFVFDGNSAQCGGAVFTSGGRMVLTDSTFVGNTAQADDTGGAICSVGGFGSIERATFTNNSAGFGGAVYHFTGAAATTLTLTNSTFVGNHASIAGGGLYIDASGIAGVVFIPVSLVHVTITQNSAGQGGGGLAPVPTLGGGPGVSLLNTIVAGNTAPTAPEIDAGGGAPQDGPISSGGNNLIGNTSGATGFVGSDLLNVANPGLSALANNGGPTPTIALLSGSPALGAGAPGAVATDQRSLPRPPGGPTDIGAFQAQIPTGIPDLFPAPFDQPLTVPAPGVLSNDVSNDPAYPILTAVIVSAPPPAEGTVTLNPDGSFTFTPAVGFFGITSFTYAVSNGTGLGAVKTSPPVTVSITVADPVPPVANPDSFSTAFGPPLTVPAPGVLGNDIVNNPNRSLSAILDTPPLPSVGTVSLNSDGSFTFTGAQTFSGVASFTYRATDGASTSPPTTVTITVAAPIPPVANPDAFSIGSNQSLTVPASGVLGNDVANNPSRTLSAVLDTPPLASDGTLILNSDGSFTFAAAPTFSGTATFTYRATDVASTSAPAIVTITGQAQTHLFAVGAGAGGGPVVRVFNEDETPRFTFFAFDPAFDGGVRVAVGDVTGDRVDDIVVGVGPGGGPHVKVFDGVTGTEVASFFAYAPDFSLGLHLAVGDVNNDGYADIITGAGSGGGPNVKVFSGLDRSELLSFFAYDPGFRGGARVGAGDLDGFPGAEIVTIAGPSGGPDVRVWDRFADTLDQFFAFDPAYRAGGFVSVLDGRILVGPDSFPDFDGSLLANQFTAFPGSRGAVGTALPSAALLTRQAQVLMFDFPVVGEDDAAGPAQTLPVLDPGFLGGVRIAAGRYRGQDGVFVTAGPGGLSRIQFFPYDGSLLSPVPTLDDVALPDPGFLGSVYVGGGVGSPAASSPTAPTSSF